MEPMFEQASAFLDQAILSYSGGQIEEAAKLMAGAAAILHEIKLAPAEAGSAEVFQPVPTATAADMPIEAHAAATEHPPEPAAVQAMDIESARKSSLAVAA